MSATEQLMVRRKLTVDEYHLMAEAGILHADDRVELIEGELIEMPPIGVAHAMIVNRLNKAFVLACGDRAIVSCQNSVRLDRFSEPQPDFALLKPEPDEYGTRKPMPDDILALVQVADSSPHYDRRIKLPLYARAGVPEVWIVNLKDRLVEVYRSAGPDGYGAMTEHRPHELLSPAGDPDITVPLARLFA